MVIFVCHIYPPVRYVLQHWFAWTINTWLGTVLEASLRMGTFWTVLVFVKKLETRLVELLQSRMASTAGGLLHHGSNIEQHALELKALPDWDQSSCEMGSSGCHARQLWLLPMSFWVGWAKCGLWKASESECLVEPKRDLRWAQAGIMFCFTVSEMLEGTVSDLSPLKPEEETIKEGVWVTWNEEFAVVDD